ncbi:MAG: hypothetical protein E7311_00555 [Clostridiales bacterium]|nr:hypothetical protein [Clostridiales bacterium]
MEYYFYSLDLDMIETLKQMKKQNIDEQEILFELKTNGEYLASYDEKKFCELVANLGENNLKYVTKEFIDLVELKKIYELTKTEFDKEIIRDFKVMIYKPISELKGIAILKSEVEPKIEAVPQKKWYEFWKK